MFNEQNPHDENDHSDGGINALRWNAHESVNRLIQAYPYADNAYAGGVDGVYEAIENLTFFCKCDTPTHREISNLFPTFYGK